MCVCAQGVSELTQIIFRRALPKRFGSQVGVGGLTGLVGGGCVATHMWRVGSLLLRCVAPMLQSGVHMKRLTAETRALVSVMPFVPALPLAPIPYPPPPPPTPRPSVCR